jgi:hypothetical protein
MSEHMGISGTVKYYHLPYDDEMGMTYCHRCKETCEKIEILLHEGIMHHWLQLKCGKCKKTIWTSEIGMERCKDDLKCHICGKKVGEFDCCVIQMVPKPIKPFCSKKCYDKFEKSEARE